jgi:hypothetical protein
MSMTYNEHTIFSMMGAINHWWPSAAVGRMGVSIPKDEIPFWVSVLIDTVREATGETFDFDTGEWSGD